MQENLAITYERLGRLESALQMKHDVYSGRLKLYGKQHEATLLAANNYAVSLVVAERFEEAKALLLKAKPLAQRVLGEGDTTTLRMRLVYGDALYLDPGATLDDLREAVTTLEEIERTARRVLGTAHPITSAIDYSLQNARAALRARETQPPSEPATTTAAVPDSAHTTSLADVVSQFGKAVSDGKFRAAVPDPEPDEGAVNPWLADQISKLAVSRDHRA